MRAIDAINRMREALRDIEGRAAFALAHQDEDEDANRVYLSTVLDGIERCARSATWGEALCGADGKEYKAQEVKGGAL